MEFTPHEPATPLDTARILIMPTSIRSVSLNQALGRLVTRRLRTAGADVLLVDLAEYPMPIYDGDIEQREGVPEAASRLVDLVHAAAVLILVSPEYNGSFPALIKNTYDWMSRVDRRCLVGVTVMLASAGPGERGGRRGLDMLFTFMTNVHATVPDVILAAGSVSLHDDGTIIGVDHEALMTFVDHAVAAARPKRPT